MKNYLYLWTQSYIKMMIPETFQILPFYAEILICLFNIFWGGSKLFATASIGSHGQKNTLGWIRVVV